MQIGTIERIWRYPVKSLAPQELSETRIEPNGLPGDRERALIVHSGHARVGKPYRGKEHNLLHLQHDEDAAVALATQRGVEIDVRAGSAQRFYDSGNVSILFSTWVDDVCAGLGERLDPLRWRPNLYVRAADDFTLTERDLTGSIVEVGDVVMSVSAGIERCVVTTYDTATGEPRHEVLHYVVRRRDNTMGVYCEVERAGTVRAGDALRLRAR